MTGSIRRTRIRKTHIPLPLKLKLRINDLSNSTDTQVLHITHFPIEVLDRIYRLLGHPRSQIAFSLACHLFAHTATSSPSSLQYGTIKVPGHHLRRYGKAELLASLKQWSWIPRGLTLCNECLVYLPRNRIWKTRQGVELKKLKRVDWLWAVGKWMEEGKICPVCRVGEGWEDDALTLGDQTKAKGKIVEEGRFLQAWPEGNINGVMFEQKYRISSGTGHKRKRDRVH